MYQREEPSPRLLRQHVEQMKHALELVNNLLGATPYQPGAPWLADLPLDAAKARQARDLLTEQADRASFVAVYAEHIDSVLRHATPAVGPAGQVVPTYPSILDALALVNPRLANQGAAAQQRLVDALAAANRERAALATDENADPAAVSRVEASQTELRDQIARLQSGLEHAPSAADLKDPLNAQIVRDAVNVTAVALRLADEAMSLAMVIYLEVSSLTPAQWFKGAPDTAELASELPADAGEIYRSLQASAQNLKELFERLRQLNAVELADTAAFRFKDGLVDDITGLALDSLHLDVQGGAEALFYSAIADDTSGSSGNDTYDYTGRLTKLEYSIQPIVLASVRASAKFDLPHWANALGLNLGYATNRVYKSGGDIEQSSLASALGVKNAFSDALDAALNVAGVHAGVRVAHFTHGNVRDVLVADGTVLAEAPLTLDMTQVDIGYDLAPRQGPLVKTFTVGFRYFDYTLPRILYQLTNSTPGADSAAYVYSAETPPQRMRTRYFMGALTGRFDHRLSGGFTPYLSLDAAVGYGPTRYYLLRDPDGLDVPDNQAYTNSYSIGLGFAGALGMRWQIGALDSRLNAYFDVSYHAQSISSTFQSKDSGDTIVRLGETDIFHGPRASFGGTF